MRPACNDPQAVGLLEGGSWTLVLSGLLGPRLPTHHLPHHTTLSWPALPGTHLSLAWALKAASRRKSRSHGLLSPSAQSEAHTGGTLGSVPSPPTEECQRGLGTHLPRQEGLGFRPGLPSSEAALLGEKQPLQASKTNGDPWGHEGSAGLTQGSLRARASRATMLHICPPPGPSRPSRSQGALAPSQGSRHGHPSGPPTPEPSGVSLT